MSLVELLAVVGAIVAPATTVATLYVNRLRERDKLQSDQKMTLLEVAVKQCESECKTVRESAIADAKAARDAAVSDRERREAAELKFARAEGELSSLTRENRELRDENRDFRERETGGHRAGSDQH